MSSSAMKTGARGGGVTVIAQAIKMLILMISVVVLSRMLPPEDIGLVAMVTVVVAFGEMLRDLGLSTAALRAQKLSHQQASNLFWLNTGLGAAGTAIMAIGAPLLVLVYGEPRLLLITPVLAVSLLINGIQAQYQVSLARQHKFVALNATDVLSQLVGFASAVAAVLAGWGYWALVVQTLVMATLLLVTRVIVAKWVPGKPAKDGQTLPLVKSGIEYSATQILTFAAGNVDTVMIGSRWGATNLGLYNRAYQLLTLPVGRLISPLVNVVVPTINAARQAGEDIYSHFLKIQSLVGLGATFIFCLAVGVANPIIPLVLGSEWSGSIILFQILAIGGAAQALSQVSFWVFLVEGQSRQLLKYNLLTKGLTVVFVVAGSFVSLQATAWALSLSLLISWPINIWWLGRTAALPAGKFLSNGLRILVSGAVAAVVALVTPFEAVIDNLYLLALVKAIFSAVFLLSLICLLPSGRTDLRRAISAIRKMRSRK